MPNEQIPVVVSISAEEDIPSVPAEKLWGAGCPSDSVNAKITISGAKENPAPSRVETLVSPPNLQLARTFAPDDQKQLNALRLLADAPSPTIESASVTEVNGEGQPN